MYDLYSSQAFEEKYTYTGCDLGATWFPNRTVFRLWAPTADEVRFAARNIPVEVSGPSWGNTAAVPYRPS